MCIKERPFNSSFKGRGGTLYIDVENGMIGFISAYNPTKIQVFNAARIGSAKTIASAMTGIRFVFYLDGKKISMPTLLTNRLVSTKSGSERRACWVEVYRCGKCGKPQVTVTDFLQVRGQESVKNTYTFSYESFQPLLQRWEVIGGAPGGRRRQS